MVIPTELQNSQIVEKPLPEQKKNANELAFEQDKENGFFDGWDPVVVAYYDGKYWGSHPSEAELKKGLRRKGIAQKNCFIENIG